MQSFDIAIVGGGMVGLTLAAALSETDLRIAIIESHTPKSTMSDSIDLRVSALNRSSEKILRHIGAWNGIVERRAAPYQGMRVWEQDSFASIEFDAQMIAQNNLGHIVENRVIQLSLLDRVTQQSNVTLFMPNQCQTMATGESEVWLTLDNGASLTAKLVVGADGANSWVRKQSDIPLTHWDYGHNAIVANIKTVEPHQGIARQIFTPQGPLAFLPLNDPHSCSIVWSTEPDRADELLALSAADFERHLTVEFDNQLGLTTLLGERAVVPLKMRFARDFTRERIALVGDAAHTVHPLAGQGVNLGLLDAASLAQELILVWQQGKDVGVRRNLRSYERWRKAEAAKMVASMQGFKELFSGENPAKKLIRGVGMSLFDHLSGPKHHVIKRALGLEGELPDIAVD